MTNLFACLSFWRGFGRLFDLGGTQVELNRSHTPAQADAIAIAQDWRSVGEDIQGAIDQSGDDVEQGATP